ncbi:hypothetical protein GCM10028775_64970 [Catellatospora paridis]
MQIDVNALNEPSTGWVTTTCSVVYTFPLCTATSADGPSTTGPVGGAAGGCGAEPPGSPADPHAPTKLIALAAVPVSTTRRVVPIAHPRRQQTPPSLVPRTVANAQFTGDELGRSPNPQPSPGAATPAPTGQPSASAAIRSLSTPGGVVHASCAGGAVTLTSWSPAQGFRADDPEPGPAKEARIRFKKDKNEMRVVVTCTGAEPVARVIPDND